MAGHGSAECVWLCAGVAADVMGLQVGASQPLMEAGLDSLAAVELRSALSARFGIAIPATVALDYPTVQVCHTHCQAHFLGLTGVLKSTVLQKRENTGPHTAFLVSCI